MSHDHDVPPNPYFTKAYEVFDNMPSSKREQLAYSVYWNTSIPIEKEIQRAALQDFGPDHPQAQGEFCWPLKK